ncbi:MAG: hypothetical protein ACTSVU_03745 [Promethearchaeota archaeon]
MKKNQILALSVGFVVLISNISMISATTTQNNTINTLKSNSLLANVPIDFMGSDKLLRNRHSVNLSLDLFGYVVSPTKENPIERNQTAILKIFQRANSNTVDLELIKNSKLNLYPSIPVQKAFYIDSNRDYAIKYNLDAPLYEFFMEINSFTNLTLFNLAFIDNGSQFNFDGILNNGFSNFKFVSAKNSPVYTIDSKIPEQDNFQVGELKRDLLNIQENSLIINNKKYLEKSTKNHTLIVKSLSEGESKLGIVTTNYGLVHENWIKYDSWIGYMQLPAQLPNTWETNTNIDIGIHRDHCSKSQILSDLQYYNKDTLQGGHLIEKNILAYEMVCHGSSSNYNWYLYQHVKHTFIFSWWTWELTGHISPTDITNLWYHSYDLSKDLEIDVYPWNTIIFADICYGYTDATGGMAHAWCDNGAKAYIGATISVPIYDSSYSNPYMNDGFVGAFWTELCVNDGTISSATTELCDYYNTNYESGWNLGDEWKIMGESGGTLP